MVAFIFSFISAQDVNVLRDKIHLQILSVHGDGFLTNVFTCAAETRVKIWDISVGDEE